MKQTRLRLVSKGSAKQQAISIPLARYLIATNTALIASGNAQLRQLFHMLWPGTTIPDHKTIVGPHLEQLFDESKKVVKVKYLNASLSLDGESFHCDWWLDFCYLV